MQKKANQPKKTNLYVNNLNFSLKWHERLQKEVINRNGLSFPTEIWNELYLERTDCKHVNAMEEVNCDNPNTAIILLGYSCMGKTSFLNQFLLKHVNYEGYGCDQLEMAAILKFIETGNGATDIDINKLDEEGRYLLGERMKECIKKHKNIIIDGQFMNVNVRGALIKTLRKLGYKTIIIASFLKLPKEKRKVIMEKRALEDTYYEVNGSVMSNIEYAHSRIESMGNDMSQKLKEIMSIKEWKATVAYKRNLVELMENIELEYNSSGLPFQAYNGLLDYGVDYYVDLKFD